MKEQETPSHDPQNTLFMELRRLSQKRQSSGVPLSQAGASGE